MSGRVSSHACIDKSPRYPDPAQVGENPAEGARENSAFSFSLPSCNFASLGRESRRCRDQVADFVKIVRTGDYLKCQLCPSYARLIGCTFLITEPFPFRGECNLRGCVYMPTFSRKDGIEKWSRPRYVTRATTPSSLSLILFVPRIRRGFFLTALVEPVTLAR